MADINTQQSNQRLQEIAETIWQHIIEQNVYLCLSEGLPIKGLPDLSEAQAVKNQAFARHMMAELEQIPPDVLTYANQVIHRVLQWDMARHAEELDLYWYQFPVTPYSSPFWMVNQIFTGHVFEAVGDLDSYLALLEGYPSMLAALLAKLEGQAERGILIPQEELDLVVLFLGSLLRDPAENPLAAAEERLTALPATDSAALRRSVDALIDDQINPAFQALLDYLGDEYRAKAPARVGIGQYEGGLEAYGRLIELHTTLPLTAQDVHQMGLAKVSELNQQMAEIRRQIRQLR